MEAIMVTCATCGKRYPASLPFCYMCEEIRRDETQHEAARRKAREVQNMVNQMVIDLMRDDTKVESLLGTINELARKENSYEYGLPTHDAGQMSMIKTAVLLWLQSLAEAQP